MPFKGTFQRDWKSALRIMIFKVYGCKFIQQNGDFPKKFSDCKEHWVETSKICVIEQNFLKVMKAINQQSLSSKLFIFFERGWVSKQKII